MHPLPSLLGPRWIGNLLLPLQVNQISDSHKKVCDRNHTKSSKLSILFTSIGQNFVCISHNSTPVECPSHVFLFIFIINFTGKSISLRVNGCYNFQEIPTGLCNSTVHYRVTKSHQWCFSQISPFSTLPSYSISTISPCMTNSFLSSLPNNSIWINHLSCVHNYTYPNHHILRDFIA